MDTAQDFSISPSALAALQARPDAPMLLDVRKAEAFAASAHMLAGATRCLPEDVASFAAANRPSAVVTYCVWGHGVGRKAADTLRAAGWDARWLAGGIEGGEPGVDAPEDIARWRAQPPLRVVKTA